MIEVKKEPVLDWIDKYFEEGDRKFGESDATIARETFNDTHHGGTLLDLHDFMADIDLFIKDRARGVISCFPKDTDFSSPLMDAIGLDPSFINHQKRLAMRGVLQLLEVDEDPADVIFVVFKDYSMILAKVTQATHDHAIQVGELKGACYSHDLKLMLKGLDLIIDPIK